MEEGRKGDENAKNIEYFLIHLISKFGFNDIIDKADNDFAKVEVEVKVNGKETDFLEFVGWVFKQYDEQVNWKVKNRVSEVEQQLKGQFGNMMAQFMHKNGLINDQEYYNKVDSFAFNG